LDRATGFEPAFSAPFTDKELEVPLGYAQIKDFWTIKTILSRRILAVKFNCHVSTSSSLREHQGQFTIWNRSRVS
jgi:hypothetical protein